MARVRFTQDFDHKPTPSTWLVFKAGQTLTVRREVADAAIAQGKATEIKAPARGKADDE